MKKTFIYLGIFAIFAIISCQKKSEGFLETNKASYSTDSLVVKHISTLDTSFAEDPNWQLYLSWGYSEDQLYAWGLSPYEYGEDYFRNLNGQPWVSLSIEGILGTQPIFLEIESVTSLNGDASIFLQYAEIFGDGTVEIPFEHNIPPGRYVISINVKNVADEQIIYDAFTVIIEDEPVAP